MADPAGVLAIPPNPRLVLAGSVASSRVTLQALLERGANVAGVFGLAATEAERVAGYARLDDVAAARDVPYADFRTLNDPATVAAIAALEPDLLWIVGLSQLAGPDVRSIPRVGCVGFHPTRLPLGRGRAAMAWNVLAGVPLAATFFLIDERADAGPLLAQVDAPAGEDDDLAARYRAVYAAIPAAVDIVCAGLRRGALALAPQDEAAATWLGARRPDDGVIDWTAPAAEIARLVTASAAPHPGAYTFQRDTRLRIERCAVAPAGRFTGVPGRIVAVGPGERFVVATADGAVVVEAWQAGEPWAPAVGMLLGYHPQLELARLRGRVQALEEALAALLAERKTEGQP